MSRAINDLTKSEKINIASIVCARHNRHYDLNDIMYEISDSRDLDIVLLVKRNPRYIVQIQRDGLAFIDYRTAGAGSVHYYCPGQYEAIKYMQSIGIDLTWYD